jgi:hypothetical protein
MLKAALKSVFDKYNGRGWDGFIWLRTRLMPAPLNINLQECRFLGRYAVWLL